MEEILKTTLLEYDKSTFLIDLVKHNTGINYISIRQTIEGMNNPRVIQINPSILSDIIYVLNNYQKEISKAPSSFSRSYFSEEKQKTVVELYLRGILIKDLVLQFNCSDKIIEQILYNKGIELVDNKFKPKYRFRRKK